VTAGRPRSVEFDIRVDLGERKIKTERGNRDRFIRSGHYIRSRKLARAAEEHPSLDLILGENGVGRDAGEAQIFSRLVAEIDCCG